MLEAPNGAFEAKTKPTNARQRGTRRKESIRQDKARRGPPSGHSRQPLAQALFLQTDLDGAANRRMPAGGLSPGDTGQLVLKQFSIVTTNRRRA
mgnify:FL=1